MQWVTWENIGIDRMGCAWLIKKYIDTEAEFIFIPATQTVFPKDAQPFDIPKVGYTHQHGHCTFYTLLAEYKLNNPVLARIARLIDEVDELPAVLLEPSAPGLDLICRGLRQISPDDYVALERGYLVYEALYAQLAQESL